MNIETIIARNHASWQNGPEEEPENNNIVTCYACGTVIEYDGKGVIEVESRTIANRRIYFCGNNCRSNELYKATETASGRADLKRLMAGLELISVADTLCRVPAVIDFDVDRVEWTQYPTRKSVSLSDFREMAMAFLTMLNNEGDVDWANDAACKVNSIDFGAMRDEATA